MIPDTLRARMGWLHAWIGFLSGLLLVCVFITGTLAVFDTELTRWLQPEVPPTAAALNDTALDKMLPSVRVLLLKGEKPFIALPSERDPVLRLSYHDGHEVLTQPFAPQSGQQIATRQTVGGTFFYDLHYTLRSGSVGITFVTFAGLMLLTVLVSGVIIHLKALIPDLLVLRPFAARLRAWLDVHVLASVPFLPFVFMMAYTGTFLHTRSVLPPESYVSLAKEMLVPSPRKSGPASPDREVPQLPSLPPLLHTAEKTLGIGQVGSILFLPDTILFMRTDASGPLRTREHVDFSYDSHFVRHVLLTSPLTRTQQVMEGIHYIRWGGAGMRWLYFFSGSITTIMIASGLILFLMKRRKTSGDRPLFQLAEGLSISVLVGLPLACAGLLWGNRLIPQGYENRINTEVLVFFSIWTVAAFFGFSGCFIKKSFETWKILLVAFSLLTVGIGFLDALTRPGWQLVHTPTVFAAVDLIAFGMGLISLQIARRLS